MSLWPLIIALFIMAAVVRRGIHAGYAIITGTFVLIIACGLLHPEETMLRTGEASVHNSVIWTYYRSVIRSLSWPALNLYLTVTGINLLGKLLIESGDIQIITRIIQNRFRDIRPVIGIIPALTGMLPMPGGVMFSAPFVSSMGKTISLSPRRMALLNYWFRHIWEYIFPLYPGMILFLDADIIPGFTIVKRQLPLTLVAIFLGMIISFHGIKSPPSKNNLSSNEDSRISLAIGSLWPVISLVIFATLLPKDYLSVVLAAVLSVYLYTLRSRARSLSGLIRSSPSLKMAALIFGIYIFRELLEGLALTPDIMRILSQSRLHPVLVMGLTSAFLAFILGYTPAAVGIMMPLIIPLVPVHGEKIAHFSYCFTFFGVLLSPFHLCLSLSVDHFRIFWSDMYRGLLPMVFVLMLTASLLLLLWP